MTRWWVWMVCACACACACAHALEGTIEYVDDHAPDAMGTVWPGDVVRVAYTLCECVSTNTKNKTEQVVVRACAPLHAEDMDVRGVLRTTYGVHAVDADSGVPTFLNVAPLVVFAERAAISDMPSNRTLCIRQDVTRMSRRLDADAGASLHVVAGAVRPARTPPSTLEWVLLGCGIATLMSLFVGFGRRQIKNMGHENRSGLV